MSNTEQPPSPRIGETLDRSAASILEALCAGSAAARRMEETYLARIQSLESELAAAQHMDEIYQERVQALERNLSDAQAEARRARRPNKPGEPGEPDRAPYDANPNDTEIKYGGWHGLQTFRAMRVIGDRLAEQFRAIRAHPFISERRFTPALQAELEKMLNETIPRTRDELMAASTIRWLSTKFARLPFARFLSDARMEYFALYAGGRTIAVILGLTTIVTFRRPDFGAGYTLDIRGGHGHSKENHGDLPQRRGRSPPRDKGRARSSSRDRRRSTGSPPHSKNRGRSPSLCRRARLPSRDKSRGRSPPRGKSRARSSRRSRSRSPDPRPQRPEASQPGNPANPYWTGPAQPPMQQSTMYAASMATFGDGSRELKDIMSTTDIRAVKAQGSRRRPYQATVTKKMSTRANSSYVIALRIRDISLSRPDKKSAPPTSYAWFVPQGPGG